MLFYEMSVLVNSSQRPRDLDRPLPYLIHSFVTTSVHGFRSCDFSSLRVRLRQPFVTGFFEDLANECARDGMGFGDLAQALTVGSGMQDGGTVDLEGRATDGTAFQPGASHASPNTLDDQVSFQLGDGRDDDDHGAAQRSARVQVLAKGNELDVESVEFIEHFEEVTGGSGQAVACPDQHDCKAAAAGIGHELIQARPARTRR